MKTKYRIYLLVIGILIALSDLVYIDYKNYLLKNITVNDNFTVIVDDNLSINYLSGINVNRTNLEKNTFSITNTGDEDAYYYINFMDVRNASDTTTYSLTSNNLGVNIDETKLLNGNNIVDSFIKIEAHNTHSYVLKIKTNTDVFFRLSIGKELFMAKSLSSLVVNNNEIKEKNQFSDNQISGLIKDIDDDGITYYFSGNVTNNYVNFANHTWKILRINGNGNIRLILDNTINSNYYNNNLSADPISLVNYENSNIKTILETWYQQNLKNYDQFISEDNYCNDLSVIENNESITYFSGNHRNMIDLSPTYICLNGIITKKISLISADEVNFAKGYNSEYFLQSSKITNAYYTLSPSYVKSGKLANIITVKQSGELSSNISSDNLAIRPVINISKNVEATGSGLINDPYIIK